MARILYIEDTENNRILVSRRLSKAGFEVLTANHAVSGLELAEKELPDVILMDMGLPGMDGWEATKHLKANPKIEHIPVIALTAHAMAGDREKTLNAGCCDYETKPFDFPRLIQKIETLINSANRSG